MDSFAETRLLRGGWLGRALGAPEFSVALFSFLLHFVWEFLQVPAYENMPPVGHWQGIRLCLSATIGDVGIALMAFWTASCAAGSRSWIRDPTPRQLGVFLTVGLGLTLVLEYYHTEIGGRWSYSKIMPIVPLLGTGLTPLLQWIIIPPVVAWLARCHIIGASTLGGRPGQSPR